MSADAIRSTRFRAEREADWRRLDEIVTRLAVVEEHTWAPPGTRPAVPPKPSDRDRFSERLGWEIGFSEFILGGMWSVDDVLRPIYKEAEEAVGREFPYPGDK